MNYVCGRCCEPISPGAAVCPHCGYNPGDEIRRQARWRWGVGALLCLTVIGGIIGVPLVISGFLHARKAADASPVVAFREDITVEAEGSVTPS